MLVQPSQAFYTDSHMALIAGEKRAVAPRSAPAYLLLFPALALLGLVLVYPIISAAFTSLTDASRFREGSFVGLANYGRLLEDDLFWESFVNNLILLLSIPIAIVIALVITGLLYKGVLGTPAYRLAIFLPFVPSVAAVGVVFIYLLASDGPLNGLLRTIGLGSLAQPWLTDADLAIWSIMAIVAWKRISLAVLLFSARMLSVDRELFQAAAVDGASWWRAYIHVGIPQLRGVLEFFAVLSVIEVFSWTFAYVFVLTQGGPFRSTYTLEFYLYQQQFFSGLPGMASAVAVTLLLMAAAFAVYRIRMAKVELA